MTRNLAFVILIFGLGFACQRSAAPPEMVKSPNGQLAVEVFLTPGTQQAAYRVLFRNEVVIDTSRLGFVFQDQAKLAGGLKVEQAIQSSIRETWEPVWGEDAQVANNYEELKVDFKETMGLERQFSVAFRVYDDGLGFRYEFPAQPNLDSVIILDENTEFSLTGDHQTWWQPGDWDIYEHLYNATRFSEIDAISKRNHPNLAQTYIPENAVNTPVTMKTDAGLYLSFHEAALYNYSDMTLKVDKDHLRWVSELVGSPDSSKVKIRTPFHTPWRTIQVAERAGDLIESHLIVNLNEPNKLENTEWIKPMKYAGIWWSMHLGQYTWEMSSGRHGATTEHAKNYIDFCAANNIKGLLVEGWNTGWEHWIGFEDREGVFDFVTPYPDYDLAEVVRYGKEKGVAIIMHHETSSAPRTYEKQLDTAFALCQSLGIHAVKTGYVGPIIPKNEYHHGQWMVNHYQKVLETAARYQVAVDAHEPIKDTGIRRTWPNFLSREGLRGQEFNAWANDGGNPPNHLPTIAFTRMLAGPIDYTPGIFDIKFDQYKPDNQVNTTLAQQLALYVVIYSPVQMAADLPENYANQPGMQFIRDVAVDWQQSKVLDGEIGDFVTIARQEKGGDRWFIGSITNENPRKIDLAFDFLPAGRKYLARIYADGPNAHWDNNPLDLVISEQVVDRSTTMPVQLAAGGGVAISLTPQ
ncbi:MAG: glycoside hydrolase family 97 protein [Lewinellaceae bacterium]|nr:glycoside hydrolase family 97 protein [Lewinellaceae bacterium]